MTIQFSPPDITQAEIDEVIDTLQSGWITTGPKTKEFERCIAQYCQTPRAVCLNSATAALELILRALDIGPGDYVAVPDYTYTASAACVCHCGATPLLIDSSSLSYEMDYDILAQHLQAYKGRIKAVICVDLAGQMCDYQSIFKVLEEAPFTAKPNTLQEHFDRPIIIADAAHSFGARIDDQRSGQLADFTAFSFHAVKNLTTAEGGALTWRRRDGIDDDELYNYFMLACLHGQNKDALAKTKMGAWEYDIVFSGYKCNMTDIMAALGLAQFRRYPELMAYRHAVVNAYNNGLVHAYPQAFDALQHVKTLGDKSFVSSAHLYLLRLKNATLAQRNEFIELMAQQGISCNVHYKPLHLMTAYKHVTQDFNYPHATRHYEQEVSLPLHTLLTQQQQEQVIESTLASARKLNLL